MRFRSIALMSVAAAGFLLAACTSAQVQQTLSGICTAAPLAAGLSALVTPLTGGASVLISQGLGAAASNCTGWASLVENTISSFQGNGQATSVSVSAASNTPVAAHLRTVAGRFGAQAHETGGKLSVKFTVAPDGTVTLK